VNIKSLQSVACRVLKPNLERLRSNISHADKLVTNIHLLLHNWTIASVGMSRLSIELGIVQLEAEQTLIDSRLRI
jgi:hypothetical protein